MIDDIKYGFFNFIEKCRHEIRNDLGMFILKLFTVSLILISIVFVIWYIKWHIFGISSGTVFKKEFVPAACITTFIPISNGKTTTLTPIINCHANEYKIWFKQNGYTNFDLVSPDEYKEIQIGQYYEE